LEDDGELENMGKLWRTREMGELWGNQNMGKMMETRENENDGEPEKMTR
jgi:hypothetical protein